MLANRTFFAVGALSLLTSIGFSQQSARNYGQGRQNTQMTGGGFAGNSLADKVSRNAPAPAESRARRVESEAPQWVSKSAILTAGDRVEYKFKLKKGDSLMAGVDSDAFDPALSLESSKGVVLIKNDDRAEGDQSPFISFHADQDQDVVLKVLSVHPNSGGKFEVRMRKFGSNEIGLGTTKLEKLEGEISNNQRLVALHFKAKKGTIYDCDLSANFTSFSPSGVIGPTGVPAGDFLPLPALGNASVFQANADGDFYVQWTVYEGGDRRNRPVFNATLKEVAISPIKVDGTDTITFGPQEYKVLTFPVSKYQSVRTVLSNNGAVTAQILPPQELKEGETSDWNTVVGLGSENSPAGGGPGYFYFLPNVDKPNDVIRVFQNAGQVRVVLRGWSGNKQKLEIKNEASLPQWKEGENLKSSLEVGEAKVMLLKSSKSEIMKVFAKAKTFIPRLEIFTQRGELANTLMNRTTKTCADDLYFPDQDTFLVRLSCEGNGGSGDFELRRTSPDALPSQLGVATTLKINGDDFGLYEVTLESGKQYELLTNANQGYLQTDLLNNEGEFMTSQVISYGSIVANYFVPNKSGKHRLWLRGASGVHKFRLALHVAPSLDK